MISQGRQRRRNLPRSDGGGEPRGPQYYESIEVRGIVFDLGASGLTITLGSFSSIPKTLTGSGVGIANNSGITQNSVINGSDQRRIDNVYK